ncbi:MAG: ABC transporter ATP-binding protein [Thermodesulfobacteriota bacterium]|nr:ABC transporter ATP-binding protein [Thermodesulfobacteriota bacterium]
MVAIEISNLSKRYISSFGLKKILALDNLNLKIFKGEIFGFLGPNGAGKTTTLKLILGLIFPTTGSIKIFNRDIRDFKVKKDIGFLPENPYFYEYLTGEEFLNFYGRLFNISKKELREKTKEFFINFGLMRFRKLPLRKYSKGMLQKIGLAQALINEPQLIILDEPMSGLDPLGRKEIRDIILKLKEEGKTVFFSTHILQDVEMICDRVGILNRGRLVEAGKLEEMLTTKIHSIEICFRKVSGNGMEKLNELTPTTFIRGEDIFVIVPELEIAKKILNIVYKYGGEIVSYIPRRETLEEYFIREIEGK